MFNILKSLAITGLASSGLGLMFFVITLPIGTPNAHAEQTSSSSQSKTRTSWSSPRLIEGRGVSNCGAARITEDVNVTCLRRASDDTDIIGVEDTHVYNATREDEQNWKGERSCVYRATYQCNFVKRD